MITDTYVTLIKMNIVNRQNTYETFGTFPAHFEEAKGINTNRTSRERSDVDKIEVYIPEVLREVDVEDILIRNPKQEDIIQCKTFKEYKQNYDAYMITSSDVYDFGSESMRHTVIGGK